MTARKQLESTARAMVVRGKGILAADESTGTCTRRFEALGIESTEESRRAYREMLFTTPGIGDFITGVIMYDETIRQSTADGRPFVDVLNAAGIIPGIKVDMGAKPLPGASQETVTEGLDGLRERLQEYAGMGARFAKWRAVIRIAPGIPSRRCIEANGHALARYAALTQEAGLVPIVEPEVLRDGDHEIERCREATEDVLHTVFHQLRTQGCLLEGTILKPNMVTSGSDCRVQAGVEEVSALTLQTLRRCVPPALPGIAFLSGGQASEDATAHLNAMNSAGPLPWHLTYSFSRALQYPALEIWGGNLANVPAAQAAFAHRARMNGAAQLGRYAPDMEKEFAA